MSADRTPVLNPKKVPIGLPCVDCGHRSQFHGAGPCGCEIAGKNLLHAPQLAAGEVVHPNVTYRCPCPGFR